MKVVIFGATGMVGQGVLRECLLAPDVDQVVAVIRTPTGVSHAKLREIRVDDFADLTSIRDELAGNDACFYCLGVSSVGMNEADYTRVSYDYPMAAARVFAELNPQAAFVYVSGAGTNLNGRQMWARVKARTERELMTLPFKAAFAFRPGFIQPLHGVVSRMRWVMPVFAATRPLSPLLTQWFPSVATTTERVGRAMIEVGIHGYPSQTLEGADINRAASAT